MGGKGDLSLVGHTRHRTGRVLACEKLAHLAELPVLRRDRHLRTEDVHGLIEAANGALGHREEGA